MISRLSAKSLASIYGEFFCLKQRVTASGHDWVIDEERLYDFFYENNYDPWFLKLVEISSLKWPRSLVIFIMKIHTGETLASGTQQWTQEQREKLGQRYLKNMAEDIIVYNERARLTVHTDKIIELKSRLELDGYFWNAKSKKLLFSEAAVLDVKEEQGILMSLAADLSLDNQNIVFHHLSLSEEHYVAEKWEDSISNSRKVLEAVLQECAVKVSISTTGKMLPSSKYDSPAECRDYLESKSILEVKEKKAIASSYSLLSDTGGHPYIAKKDQARLMRHLALTYSQYVMLRLKGFLQQPIS